MVRRSLRDFVNRAICPSSVFLDDPIRVLSIEPALVINSDLRDPLPRCGDLAASFAFVVSGTKRVQLVRVTHKHVPRSRRTGDLTDQRTRPSALHPKLPGDR